MRFYNCNSIEEMRNVPAEELGDFENRMNDFREAENQMANLSPNIDGYLLKENL